MIDVDTWNKAKLHHTETVFGSRDIVRLVLSLGIAGTLTSNVQLHENLIH